MSNGPKIVIGADTSSVLSELAKVKAAAEKINKELAGGSVGLDTRAAVRDMDELTSSAAELKKALGSAGNVANMDEITATLKDAEKAASDLSEVLKFIGHSTSGSSVIRDLKQQVLLLEKAAKTHKLLNAEGFVFAKTVKETARAAGTISSNRPDATSEKAPRNQSIVGFVKSIVGTGVAGVASNILPGGVSSKIMSAGVTAAGETPGGIMSLGGMARLGPAAAGATAAYAGLKLFQSVSGKINSEQEEGRDYSDLRKMLALPTDDFSRLRDATRELSTGLGVSYNELAKLTKGFVSVSAATDGIGDFVKTAVGLGRGYGVDPAQSVQFMANMKHFGQGDDRRLAIQIADAVSRGGNSAKMDDVMSSVQSFVTMAARASLTTPDAGAYASMVGSLTRQPFSGLSGDPLNAAAIIGKADAALRGGGAAGEASKNLSLALYQSKIPGFDAFDLADIEEQGATGSFENAFGENSPKYIDAQNRNDTTEINRLKGMAKAGGKSPLLFGQLAWLRSQSKNNKDFHRMVMGHLGLSSGEAYAMGAITENDADGGKTMKSLTDAGIDLKSIKPTQFATLAQLSNGDSTAIKRQRDLLLWGTGKDAISKPERDSLNTAVDNDSLKKAVLAVSANHFGLDQADEQRIASANLSNNVQRITDDVIPAVTRSKELLGDLVAHFHADGLGFEGRKSKESTEQTAAYEENRKQAIAKYDDAQKFVAQSSGAFKPTDKQLTYTFETDKLLSSKPGTNAAQIQVESGWDNSAVSARGARGIAQLMPREKAEMERRLGHPINDVDSMLEANRAMLLENKAQLRTTDNAYRAYNGGWNPKNWGSKETQEYLPRIAVTRNHNFGYDPVLNAIPSDDDKIPANLNPQQGRQDQQVVVKNQLEHTITVLDSLGRPYQGLDISTKQNNGKPIPAGLGR